MILCHDWMKREVLANHSFIALAGKIGNLSNEFRSILGGNLTNVPTDYDALIRGDPPIVAGAPQ